MLWCCLIEIDLLLSVIAIIIYGLVALKSKQIFLNDVYLFCRLIPLLFVVGHGIDSCSLVTELDLHKMRSLSSWAPWEGGHGVDLVYAFNIVSFDMMLALLLFVIMFSFKSFEAVLLLLFAFIGQYYMLHSVDLLSFYIALEAQNFCFLVLCGLPMSYSAVCRSMSIIRSTEHQTDQQDEMGTQGVVTLRPFPLHLHSVQVQGMHGVQGKGTNNHSYGVEASLKYFLLSAFSSGVILFWFSILYLQTGNSSIYFLAIDEGYSIERNLGESLYQPTEGHIDITSGDLGHGYFMGLAADIYSYQILCAMMFKLGAAPLHLWVVQIYNGVKRQLLMYIGTAPKLALFGFWINSFHGVWTDYSLLLFSLFSLVLGSFGAYYQPGLRSLFAYSTVNEIGLMLSALEVAGYHNLMQHLGIYIITQLLLWNMEDKRLFTIVAVSLAGLPPLAGFFGKAWILWGLSSIASGGDGIGLYVLLLVALFCTVVSFVYYLRVLRLFFSTGPNRAMPTSTLKNTNPLSNVRLVQYNNCRIIPSTRTIDNVGFIDYDSRVFLTSTCVIALFVIPFFVMKPFVL